MKKGLVLSKFILAGGLCTFIDFILYMLLSMVISVTYAKGFSMICSCTVSFFLNKFWIFKEKGWPSVNQILKYVAVQIINISINVGSNKVIYDFTNVKILAFMVATFMAMMVNYLLQKRVVFREE